MKDPIVEEIREARRKHAQQFDFDLHAICTDLKKKEKEYEQKYGHPLKSKTHQNVQAEVTNNES